MPRWLVIAIGAFLGAVTGAVVAVNVVIFSGLERGYETGLGQLFEEAPVVGVAVVAIWVAGPVVGALLADRLFWRPRQK